MDNFNNQQLQGTAKRSFFSPKIIFIILGVIVLAEVVYAVRVLTSFVPSSLPERAETSEQPAKPGKISLNTIKTSYQVQDQVSVSVMIDTGFKEITGVDLIVQFDPEVLEATSGGIVKGKILDEYPLVSVDSKKGVVSVSGISSLISGFKGSGLFALINFRAKAPGKTALMINFQKGATTASNLVEASTAKNILEQVDNLELEIQ